MTVRTRMAPSPTGEYHIGHIRTILYNFAFAKRNNGKFIIRIEDTDRERYVEGAEEKILDVISNYGFEWDEGPKVGGEYGPYIQSKRLKLYKKYADKLVEKEAAYYCFCSTERLKELREEQRAKKLPTTKYDKKCVNTSTAEAKERISRGERYVVRLNVPEDRDILFNDLVYGEVTVNSSAMDDQILLKSDGYPSYHLAVVVDDHLMEISHVMRGNDWISSTPKHILIYEALGWALPVYAHLPNLKEQGQEKKLSKRFGPVGAARFLEEGYLPEAVLNFLMFLGWNPGTEKEIYSIEEFINDFSIDRVHKTDLVSFDREKLIWLNGWYIREMGAEKLYERIVEWSKKYGVDLPKGFLDELSGTKVLELVSERLKFLNEVPGLIDYFYNKPNVRKDFLTKYSKEVLRAKEILSAFVDEYGKMNDWKASVLESVSSEVLEKKEYKPKEAYMTLRVAISGVTATPPIFDVLEIIGKDEVIDRINGAISLVS